MDFHGKVALVTGGTRGIGRAISEALLRKGCKVCAAGLKVAEGETSVRELRRIHGEDSIIFVKCDVSSPKDIEEAFHRVTEWASRLDIVVNNAGILNEYDWSQMVEVNLVGCIRSTLLGFRYMGIDRGGNGGVIVNMSSALGLEPVPVLPVYSATKFAVIGLSRNYGTPLHYSRTGVTVNVVCPEAVATDMLREAPQGILFPELSQRIFHEIKSVEPSYVAQGVLKAISDRKNGSVLKITHSGFEYQ